MPTTYAAARALLALESAPDDEVAAALESRIAHLRDRLAVAPTPSLRAKLEQQLEALESARPDGERGGGAGDLPLAASAAPAARDEPAGGRPAADTPPGVLLATTPLGAFYRLSPLEGDERAICRLHPINQASLREEVLARLETARDVLDSNAGGPTDVEAGEAAMEFALRLPAGETLRERLARNARVRRMVAVPHAIGAVARLAGKLAAAADFAHGDLRPETLWIDEAGELRVLGLSAGRPPELRQAQAADAAGLASVLLEMIAGVAAAPSPDELKRLCPDLPAPAQRAILRALSRETTDRYRTAGEFGDAVTDQAASVRLPPGLGRLVDQHGQSRVLAVAGALAALVLVGATYPLWKDASPWRGASDRREAARLSGVVDTLAAQAGERRARLEAQLGDARREETRLLEKLEGARTGEEYDEVLPRYLEATLASKRLAAVKAGFDRGPEPRLAQARLTHAEAANLLKAEEVSAALTRFQGLEQEYRAVAAAADGLLAQATSQEAARAARLAGRWGVGGCETPSQWTFAGDVLTVQWPGQGQFRERLVGADETAVYTVGVSPQQTAGKMFSYNLAGDELTVQQLGRRGQQMKVRRC